MAIADGNRGAGLPDEGGIADDSDPERTEAVLALSASNETLFNGVLDRIHNQTEPGLARLAVHGLVGNLGGRGISGPDGRTTVSYGDYGNAEGSYRVTQTTDNAPGRAGHYDRMLYRLCGDRCAHFEDGPSFSFREPQNVQTNADANTIARFEKMVRAMNDALLYSMGEFDTALAEASTTFDDGQKERVADALLKLDDDFGGQLEIEDRDIERLDSMLKGAQALVELGVRVNPIVFASFKKTVADLEKDVRGREVRLKGKGYQNRIRVALARALGSISLVVAGKTPPSPAAAEETRRFEICKADILAKLSALGQTLAGLEDADLTDLGSDKFVSLGLECLGHKLPEIARA